MKQILLCALVAVGCGGSSPREQCEDLLGTTCDRVTECFPANTVKDTCITQLKTGLPCDTAKSVSARYDECVNQINGASCSTLLVENRSANTITVLFPSACTDVIVTGQAAPDRASSAAPPDVQASVIAR